MTSQDQESFVLVTGASGGIGRAVSLRLASIGYNLILHYCQNAESVHELKSIIEQKYNRICIVLQADFNAPKQTITKLKELHIDPEVIIHNSGTSHSVLFQDESKEQIDSAINVSLTTPALITKTFLPAMLSRRKGKIIFITSIWGLTGASCEVTYSMVKGGQNSLVKALAKEVAPSGIQVNGIAPGAINTEMLSQYDDEELKYLCEDIPAGRLGKAEEIANVVRFLISDDSNYINGQILSVNGGWYC